MQLVDETEELAHSNLSMEAVWKERSCRLSACIEKLQTVASEVSSLQSKLAQAIDEQGPESQYYNLQVIYWLFRALLNPPNFQLVEHRSRSIGRPLNWSIVQLEDYQLFFEYYWLNCLLRLRNHYEQ